MCRGAGLTCMIVDGFLCSPACSRSGPREAETTILLLCIGDPVRQALAVASRGQAARKCPPESTQTPHLPEQAAFWAYPHGRLSLPAGEFPSARLQIGLFGGTGRAKCLSRCHRSRKKHQMRSICLTFLGYVRLVGPLSHGLHREFLPDGKKLPAGKARGEQHGPGGEAIRRKAWPFGSHGTVYCKRAVACEFLGDVDRARADSQKPGSWASRLVNRNEFRQFLCSILDECPLTVTALAPCVGASERAREHRN